MALPLLAEPYFRMRPFCGVRNVRIRWHILVLCVVGITDINRCYVPSLGGLSQKMIESPFKCERPIHSLADSSDALTAASVLWEVTISPHSSIWRLRCLHTLQFGGYGVSTLFNLEVTVSPHSQLGVLSSYGELRDGFPPTFDLLNRCFVICFFCIF